MLIILAVALLIVFVVVIFFLILNKKSRQVNNISLAYQDYKNSIQNQLLDLHSKQTSLNASLEYEKQKNQELKQDKIQRLEELKQELKQQRNKSDDYIQEIKDYKVQISKLETQLKEKLEQIKNNETRLKNEFENLANRIFEDNSKKLTQRNQETLTNVLDPVKQQLKDFKQKVEDVYDKESNARSALQNELKNLKELNQKITTQADNLTNALRSNSKQQGIWGEMVLENILEKSGLRKDFEYFREKSIQDDQGKSFRPDVVIKLPNDRDIIIDSKTSLSAYNEYMAADESQKQTNLKKHIKSLKEHIEGLAKKNYEDLKDINSLDFIFMFIPIEGALLLALDNDTNLYDQAFKQKIILVSPATLLVALRAVENVWRYEKQAQSIAKVYSRAEKLYKKFVNFVEDLEKLGRSISDANQSYENAFNKLTSGKGNLIWQARKLESVSGIKVKERLNNKLIEDATIGNDKIEF